MPQIRDLIHKSDPYQNFPLDEHPHDPQGWGAAPNVFKALIDGVRPSIVIEVGSWKGASAVRMAQFAKAAGLHPEIVCVDTWLGSPGLYTRKDDKFYESLRFEFGYPRLYHTFLSNVIRAGFPDVITPFPLPSLLAAEVLAHFKVQADLIYIDAAHDYGSVIADLEAYWPLLKADGVLFGDDYIKAWPGVVKAAKTFAAREKRSLYAGSGKFIIAKDLERRFDPSSIAGISAVAGVSAA